MRGSRFQLWHKFIISFATWVHSQSGVGNGTFLTADFVLGFLNSFFLSERFRWNTWFMNSNGHLISCEGVPHSGLDNTKCCASRPHLQIWPLTKWGHSDPCPLQTPPLLHFRDFLLKFCGKKGIDTRLVRLKKCSVALRCWFVVYCYVVINICWTNSVLSVNKGKWNLLSREAIFFCFKSFYIYRKTRPSESPIV